MKKLILILMLLVGGLALWGQKIADLPTATSLAATDLLIIDKTAATSGISITNFFKTVPVTLNMLDQNITWTNSATIANSETDTLDLEEKVIKADGIFHAFGSIKARAGLNMLDQNITWTAGGDIQNDDTDTLTLAETVVQVDGILNVIDLKTSTTTVLTPTSAGNVDTLETDDIGDIAFTLSGAMTYVSTEGLMTIGTGGTFERLNEGAIAYTGLHLHDFTHSDGRLTYTGTNTKHFTINVRINIEGEEDNQRVAIQLYQDGALIAATNDQHDFTAVDTDDSIGFTWLVEMATNEYVELHGTSDVNADEFTVLGGSMVISQH